MRRAKPEKRKTLPDIRYNNVTLQTMIHHIMSRGKKSVATHLVYDTMDLISKRSDGKNPVEVFDTAMRNVAPLMEVRPRRVGGATYQVPMEVPTYRRRRACQKWQVIFRKIGG
jgi:small subunit ribosomal protein S7